jgi:hypothetical protein
LRVFAGGRSWPTRLTPSRVRCRKAALDVSLTRSGHSSTSEADPYASGEPVLTGAAAQCSSDPFRAEFLGGVAVSHPMNEATLPKHLGIENSRDGTELGRLVLLDDDALATNAESWFIARAFRLRNAKPEVRGVLAFCDPVERKDVDGTVTKPGHCGIAYRASGSSLVGRSAARHLLLAPTGRVISGRALSKLRRGERGADYAERQLRDNGAPPRSVLETGTQYVARFVANGHLKPFWHPGNLA